MNPTDAPAHPAYPPTTRTTDMHWLRWGLAAIAFLLMVIAVELSALIGPIQPRAQAQIPDSGAQLNQLIEGQKQLQHTLQQVLDQLRTGEIKVSLSGTDKESKGAPAPAPRTNRPAGKPSQTPRAG